MKKAEQNKNASRGKKSRKKLVAVCVTAAVILAVLFMPFVRDTYDDGGTVTYSALTYKIVKWKKLAGSDKGNGANVRYEKTSLFFFPENYKTLDELWETEKNGNPDFFGKITEGTATE